MTLGLLLAFAAAISYGFLGISFEIAGKRLYHVWDVILVKQFTGFCIGLLCALLMHTPFFDGRLLGLGCIGAISYVAGLAAYLTASREKSIAVNWTILNLSVVVPIILSVMWFGDAFTTGKLIGILCTVLSIVIIGSASGTSESGGRASSRWLACITIAFLLNGVLVILFRFVPDKLAALFTAYFYGISLLLIAAYKLAADRSWKPATGLVGVGVAGAATHWSGMMLTIAALARIGRVSKETGLIVYPITNGLVIPVGVVLGVALLKQRVNLRVGFGVLVGIAALVLLFL